MTIHRIFTDVANNDPEGFKKEQDYFESVGDKVVKVDANGGYQEEKGKIDFDLNEEVMQQKFALDDLGQPMKKEVIKQ